MIARVAVAALVLAAAPARAVADPWTAQTEAGVAYDSNVGHTDAAVAAPVSQAGARLEGHGGDAARLRWGLRAEARGKALLSGPAATENALTSALDVTAIRRTGAHLAIGARATHYQVWPSENPRAFASSGADLSVAIDGDRGRRATIAAGVRRVDRALDDLFDWTGPAIALSVEDPIWRDAEDRAIDVAAGYRLEHRTFRGIAYRNICPPGEPLAPRCYVPGDRVRYDLAHVAGVRATYTGGRIATVGYDLIVHDSTSFGDSRLRQRLTASLTEPLPYRIFATATVTAQLDHYPEPPLIQPSNSEAEPLDDESRSSAAVRLARALDRAWQVEVRYLVQGASLNDARSAYFRQVAYAGVTWER